MPPLSEADEAATLLERVRDGDLDPAMLRLAAHLGHLPARLAARGAAEEPAELKRWIAGLSPYGKEASVRVALAAARCVLPPFERQHPHDRRPHRLCAAAEAWLLDPGPVTLRRAVALLADVGERGFPGARYASATVSLLRAVQADEGDAVASDLSLADARSLCSALSACEADVYVAPGELDPDAPQAVLMRASPDRWTDAVRALRRYTGISLREAKRAFAGETAFVHAARAIFRAADPGWQEEALSAESVRAAARTEGVPWALGYGEPLRRRGR